MAAVDLVRTENGLVGVVGDQRVDVVLDLPNSHASIRGESFGVRVDGYWHIESNYDTLDPVGLFLGEYDGSPVFVRNEVHLTPHYALRHADIGGAIVDQELRARVEPVEAPAHGPSVVGIDGRIDGESITLFVAVAIDLSGAHIDGVVGGRPINIEATRSSITGQYAGPPALFPLVVCCLLYFL